MSLGNVQHIILVLSGKGGVGKSSLTTQLALSLSLQGHSVGILDLDLTGPSIPRLLGLENAKIRQVEGGWRPVEVHPAQTLPPLTTPAPASSSSSSPPTDSKTVSESRDTVHSNGTPDTTSSTPSLPIGSLHAASLAFLLPSRSSAVVWRGPKKTAMVRQFLTDVRWPSTSPLPTARNGDSHITRDEEAGLEYLLIDTPPGTSDEHISLAETLLKETSTAESNGVEQEDGSKNRRGRLEGAVVVTTPQAVATADVKKEINFCRKTGIPVLGVVENMSGFVCECCGEETNLFGKGGGEVMSREFGERFLGNVPVDLGWGAVVEEGGWARYGEVEQRDGAGERLVSGDGEAGGRSTDEREDDGRSRRKEEALLVQRYRSCRLSNVVNDITKRVVAIVEAS